MEVSEVLLAPAEDSYQGPLVVLVDVQCTLGRDTQLEAALTYLEQEAAAHIPKAVGE